jgi:DeoR/GlpR family transcriptional regulator of sugar metabolism
MRPRDRRQSIAAIVREHGRSSVEALADRFAVSAETIRRDLAELAAEGALLKVHGGAVPPRLLREASFAERLEENAEGKRTIAAKLAAMIAPGTTLFIDTGSTTLACAERLAGLSGLTVITNSLGVARVLGAARAPGTTIYLLGGAYHDGNAQTVGPLAIRQVAAFQADYAVLAITALDAASGVMDASVDEAQVARAMIDCSHQLVVVADHTKFGQSAGFTVARLPEIDTLVTDRRPSASLAGALAAADVAVA